MQDFDEKIGRYIVRKMEQEDQQTECPSMVTLSLFMEEQLKGNQARAIRQHLVGCKECREQVAECMTVLDEIGEISGSPEVAQKEKAADRSLTVGIVRFINSIRHWKWGVVPLGVTAFALLMLVINTHRSVDLDDLIEPLLNVDPGTVQSAYIGNSVKIHEYGFYQGIAIEKAAFRLGVLLSGLEIALKIEDEAGATVHLETLITLLESMPTGDENSREAQKLLNELRLGNFPLTALVLEKGLTDILKKEKVDFYFKFGQWLQAGKLAAVAGDIHFFRKQSIQYYLEQVDLRSEVIPPGVVVALGDVKDIRDNGREDAGSLKEIENAIEEIITILM